MRAENISNVAIGFVFGKSDCKESNKTEATEHA